MLKYIFTQVILLLPLCLFAQEKVNDINFAHAYDPKEELFIQHRMVENPTNGKLLVLGIELNNQSTSIEDYSVSFISASDYNSTLETTLTPQDTTYIGERGRTYFLGYKFSAYPPLIIVKITSTLSGLSFYQDIRTTDVHSFMLKDNRGIPLIQPFINQGRYNILATEPVEVTYYNHEFPPARAPMTTDPGDVPRTMDVTETFGLDLEYDHIYEDDGLYHVRTGTSPGRSGESFRVQGPYFPEYVTVNDLIEPLIYITTTRERQKLRSAGGDKKRFDEFWVEMAGGKDKARWIIKNYYDHVADANKFFTTYKEGWKTDRGMIYIIFGTPDQVIREQDTEIWSYLAGKRLPPMTFKFVTLQSRYADRQFSLIRDGRHRNGYLAAARYWREARPMDER